MQAYKEIIDGDKLAQLVSLPDGWKSQKLEMIVWPVEAPGVSKDPVISVKGKLKAYAKQERMVKEKELGWELAMKDKHAKN
ncbi:MAG: hypothetical protein HQM12_11865 [SAR324 cluster bacterium]|nr:hypothetical protein [SAR324 cluster bacterium]